MRKLGEAMIGIALVGTIATAITYRMLDSSLMVVAVAISVWVAALRYKGVSRPLALYALFPLAAAVMYFLYSAVNSSVPFRYSTFSVAMLAMVMFFIYKKGAKHPE